MKLKVHLVFPGTCEEAFALYKEALGGEISFLFRKKEDKSQVVADADKEKISHMVLRTKYFDLAAEDANVGEIVESGNNNKLVLAFDDLDQLNRVFTLFSEGGEVVMPLEKTFFCDAFGELKDRFGIRWIIMMSDEGYQA